jgi:hypothetical protein
MTVLKAPVTDLKHYLGELLFNHQVRTSTESHVKIKL